jgi:hypothetical protein
MRSVFPEQPEKFDDEVKENGNCGNLGIPQRDFDERLNGANLLPFYSPPPFQRPRTLVILIQIV